ncbi:GNAT family N-acetyltransferase [Lentzea aerocolonigenes]|uniref:GNAT family N-acetyltransferase n=1 Tax=Lentzea aerocolonigenes TaxID=68170 RepID=UPI0004C3C595|nr:GNAT family N-acetyltransferase [Lentzea aerocolonigenes]MCP2244115.1 Protein N-acetyltransferase, RimJ/RimL family [Lentzea aerocolonigenes]
MTVVLSTPGAALWLRPWRSGDRGALVAAHRDPELRKRLVTSLADDTEAGRWLDAQASGWASATRFSFAVVADDNDPLGHVVVKAVGAGVAEVGYWTAARARGRGIATSALETASRWALDTQQIVRLTRLDLLHAEDNPASCQVAEKCGYVLHDVLPPAPPAFPSRGHRHVRS